MGSTQGKYARNPLCGFGDLEPFKLDALIAWVRRGVTVASRPDFFWDAGRKRLAFLRARIRNIKITAKSTNGTQRIGVNAFMFAKIHFSLRL
jgi:hypothetical protein